jgi:hypothetical protein
MKIDQPSGAGLFIYEDDFLFGDIFRHAGLEPG